MVSFWYPVLDVAHARLAICIALSRSLSLPLVFLAGKCENSENENQMQTPQPAEKMTQKKGEVKKHRSALCGHCSVECIRKIVLKGRLVGLQMMRLS